MVSRPASDADEDLFEFVPEVVVEVGALEQAAKPAEEAAAGPLDGAFGLLVEFGLFFRRRLEGGFFSATATVSLPFLRLFRWLLAPKSHAPFLR